MTTSRTIRGNFLFKVSEYGDGTPFIVLESRQSQKELEKILVGFDLPNDTSLDRAKEIAHYLNQNLGDLQMTFFDGAAIH
ncbi:hypothetical protein TFLX_03893 [Thermoflexales bacterium]|nr:hypothetical protein TFLX_03893 [Thermoflexales bacterium]